MVLISSIQLVRKVLIMMKSKRYSELLRWPKNKSTLPISTSMPTSKLKCLFSTTMTMMMMNNKKNLPPISLLLLKDYPYQLSPNSHLHLLGSNRISFRNLLKILPELSLKNLKARKLICLQISRLFLRKLLLSLLRNRNLNRLFLSKDKSRTHLQLRWESSKSAGVN